MDETDQIRKQFEKPYDKTLEENKQILQQYCDFINQKKLKLLFVVLPHSDFYREYWKEDYYLELMDYLVLLKAEYQIEYLDLSHVKLPDHYFRDNSHLNRIGAIYVSEEINKWLEKS